MSFLGVSVTCVTHKLPTVSASGIKVCDHFILTHCSVVWNVVKECIRKNINIIFGEKDFISFQKLLVENILQCNSKFSVVLPTCDGNVNSKCVLEESGGKSDDSSSDDSSSDIQWDKLSVCNIEASVEQIIASPCLIFEFLNLLCQSDHWKFDKGDEKDQSNKYLEIVYLSTFLILRTKEGGDLDHCFAQLEKITSRPKKGTTAFIDGCPFGFNSARAVFLNSISRGIVSNISHSGNIILTDARCIIGCEGAPTYSLEYKFCICGIVLSPFCWMKGEWVGLTFVAAIQPLLAYIRSTMERANTVEMYPLSGCSFSPTLESADESSFFYVDDETLGCQPSDAIKEARLIPDMVSVVNKSVVRIVRRGTDDWGTGVVVSANKGLVVTCAHVTRGAPNKAVDVIFWDGERQRGAVIFESEPRQKEGAPSSQFDRDFDIWDLAVVQLPVRPRNALPLSKELPEVGAPVLVGGHPLFRADALSTSTFSLGNLAKVSAVYRRSWRQASSSAPSPDERPGVVPFTSALPEGLVCSRWRPCALSDDVIPVLLQTTCAVYNGVSGGPVVALHPGKGVVVIGIVSCCARDVESKVCFPHVNLATPVFPLAEALDQFNVTEDSAVFNSLNFRLPSSFGIWKLKAAPKSKL